MTGASRAFRRSNDPRMFNFPAASTVAASHNVKISTFIIQATSHGYMCISLKSTNTRGQNSHQIADWDSLLLHRIPIAQRDCIAQRSILFPERFKINSHSKGRADFILTPIAAADGPALIIENRHVRSQEPNDLFCLRDKRLFVLKQREDRTFDGCDARMESENDTCFHYALIIRRFVS